MENKIITIQSVEQSNGRVKIKDENGLVYSFFVKIQSGEFSKAYQHTKQFGELSELMGKIVSITYAENSKGEYNGNPIVYRNIVGIFPAVEEKYIKDSTIIPKPVQNPPTSQILPNSGALAPQSGALAPMQEVKKDKDWDRIGWGKCKTLFLVELMKMDKRVGEAEPMAEEWANAAMRKLPVDPYFNNLPTNIWS
jgi:hypothetical protein